MRAMKDELTRSVAKLQLQKMDKPYSSPTAWTTRTRLDFSGAGEPHRSSLAHRG